MAYHKRLVRLMCVRCSIAFDGIGHRTFLSGRVNAPPGWGHFV